MWLKKEMDNAKPMPMPRPPKMTSIWVTVIEDSNIEDIKKELANRGAIGIVSYDTLGVISCNIRSDLFELLFSIKGVEAVETKQEMRAI